jgi:hypothetical protein
LERRKSQKLLSEKKNSNWEVSINQDLEEVKGILSQLNSPKEVNIEKTQETLTPRDRRSKSELNKASPEMEYINPISIGLSSSSGTFSSGEKKADSLKKEDSSTTARVGFFKRKLEEFSENFCKILGEVQYDEIEEIQPEVWNIISSRLGKKLQSRVNQG